jgi:hypothetical protein
MQSKFLVALALIAAAATATYAVPGGAGSTTLRRYGGPVQLGGGRARTYVVTDQQTGNPIEVGVALDQAALHNLPASGTLGGGGHEHYTSQLLSLPAGHNTPYQFVELNWNPKGHGGPYTAPHFDFHFYRISLDERNAIDPAKPEYATRTANLPATEELPAGYVSSHQLLNLTPAQASVPRMGLHWVDMASPELPPKNQPFTATFILGSWDGKVIFDEPMITRDFILSQRDSTAAREIPVPAARRYRPAGFYLRGYRVSFDARSGEYRIALTGLSKRS